MRKKELDRLKNVGERKKSSSSKRRISKANDLSKKLKINNVKTFVEKNKENGNIKIQNKNVKKIIDDRRVIKNTKKNKKIRKALIIMLFTLFVLLVLLVCFLKEDKKKLSLKKEQELIEEITNHYNNYVKTNKDALLYNNNNEVVGKVSNGIELSLLDTNINKNTRYFEISDFEGYYIKYEDVEKIDLVSEKDTRYKYYIVFNENIITNDKTKFYDEDNNLVYEFNKSYNLPIIIKDIDRYGVEFNSRLLYVKNEDIKEIEKFHNTDVSNSNGVLVLNYHAFYDETSLEESRECPTIICHSKKQFKTHLDYIKENNILTLTMNEFEMYLDKKIQIPKSVLITIDDGGRTTHAINMLTEYKMNATIFLVTSWYNPTEYPVTEYIELHSHTHNMHNVGDCPTGQGGGIQCLDRNFILDDLKMSRQLLNNTTAFCYPFYEYNSYSINLLKEAGFTIAFAGHWGNLLVKPGVNKYIIPRYVITTSTSISSLDYYFRQISN